MHLLLLRSLLREMIADLTGPASTVDEPTRGGMTRYLIVVARTEPAVYEHLRNRHFGDPKVRVMLDRRGANDVEMIDGPPPVVAHDRSVPRARRTRSREHGPAPDSKPATPRFLRGGTTPDEPDRDDRRRAADYPLAR